MEDIASQISYNQENFQSKTILENEKQKAIIFAFSEGQELKAHKAKQDVFILILEGECNFVLDGAAQTLKAGQVFRIPANVLHSLIAATNFKMVLLK
ncbi:cupin domain-containing protein [Pontibacter silvestris]|uniref:Cupin domain-containing protein n=1 Tax=Pontibacter silvestris TaxID=2305183 RepID=A0ABW4WUT2_9BACT|nr:cupin domain-containing protein [Pontibacter silvestris]MCC9136469.1 cupin domain-containing protein [Pontibacter silvestris]